MLVRHIHKTIWSLRHAFRGLRFGFETERNFKIEFIAIVLGICFMIFFSFSYTDLAIFVMSGAATLGAELLNSAIEESWNKLHPEIHHSVGRIKDLAAAGVLCMGLGTGISFCIMTLHHFL